MNGQLDEVLKDRWIIGGIIGWFGEVMDRQTDGSMDCCWMGERIMDGYQIILMDG